MKELYFYHSNNSENQGCNNNPSQKQKYTQSKLYYSKKQLGKYVKMPDFGSFVNSNEQILLIK